MTKRRHNLHIVWLAAALALSGCIGFDAIPTAAPPQSSAALVTEPAKTSIVYARGMDETTGTSALLAAYNAQSEDVVVRYQELPSDSDGRHRQLMDILAASGVEIDVFDADIVWPAGFAARGGVMPMDGYVQQEGIDLSNYWPGMISALTYQGILWGLPKTASAGVLYYRTDLLDDAPATWQELITAAANAPEVRYGFVAGGANNDTLVSMALELIYAYGGQVLDADGNVLIQTENAVTGLTRLRELYTSDFVPPDIRTVTDSDACMMFLNGEAAMMRNWPHAWAINRLTETAAAGKFALAPLPAGDAGASSVLGGAVMMMNAKTKHPDAVWDFMRFTAGKEGQTILAAEGGRVPALRSVMQLPEVVAGNPHFDDENFILAIENAVPRAVTPFYTNLSTIMQEELVRFLAFEQDAEATAARIGARLHTLFYDETYYD